MGRQGKKRKGLGFYCHCMQKASPVVLVDQMWLQGFCLWSPILVEMVGLTMGPLNIKNTYSENPGSIPASSACMALNTSSVPTVLLDQTKIQLIQPFISNNDLLDVLED